MSTMEKNRKTLPDIERSRLNKLKQRIAEVRQVAEECATAIEDVLVDDAALAEDEGYGFVCRVLGVLDELIDVINYKLNKLKQV